MRILHISTPFLPVRNDLEYGGTERVVYLLDKKISERGHESYVAAPGTSEPTGKLCPTIAREIGVASILNKENGMGFDDLYSMLEHMSKSLRYARGFDFVHAHDEYAVPFMPMLNSPSLVTLHSDYEGGFWDSVLHPDITRLDVNLVAISNVQRNVYMDAGYNVEYVVYNGVDTDNVTFSDKKKDYLLTLGSIMPVKGQHTAIAVGRSLGLDVIVAGNIGNHGYFDEKIKPFITHDLSGSRDKLADYLSLGNSPASKVVYVGRVNDEQKMPLYANAKTFLMPVEWEEPFGLVMIEAMASGTPVIAYNRGAIPEIVADGKTGYIVANAEEMQDAVKNAGRIKPEDCRQHVIERFSAERMAEDYLKLYQHLSGSN